MQRYFGLAGAVMLFFTAVFCLWGLYGTHTILISAEQIQERMRPQLGKEFPVAGRAHALLTSVSVQGAEVHIEDGHVIALLDIAGVLRTNKRFTLTAYTVGVPEYAHGEFYFKPSTVEVQRFAYEGSAPTELFSRVAKRYLSERKQQLVADIAPKLEEWMTQTAQRAAIHTLESRPVYRPKDDVKGYVIRASLGSVTVDGDHITATFSLWRLTMSVALGVVSLIALVVLCFTFPELFFLGAMVG